MNQIKLRGNDTGFFIPESLNMKKKSSVTLGKKSIKHSKTQSTDPKQVLH